jgi:prolyl-tRNA synthetase
LEERRGIEVGHVFQLGTKYSEAMGATFTGQDGKLHPFIMGCYGIGTSRVAAAAVEQHHDHKGMKWPVAIAPFHCVVVPAKGRDESCVAAATKIYDELRAKGVEAVLDDRDLGPGVKFKDWELVGLPFTVVCGRGLAEGKVELKRRSDLSSEDVAVDEVVSQVAGLIAGA